MITNLTLQFYSHYSLWETDLLLFIQYLFFHLPMTMNYLSFVHMHQHSYILHCCPEKCPHTFKIFKSPFFIDILRALQNWMLSVLVVVTPFMRWCSKCFHIHISNIFISAFKWVCNILLPLKWLQVSLKEYQSQFFLSRHIYAFTLLKKCFYNNFKEVSVNIQTLLDIPHWSKKF